MASRIETEGWVYATVPITNPENGCGTGFLVSRINPDGSGKVYLVTNKHVIHINPAERNSVRYISCSFNTRKKDGSIGILDLRIPLICDDGVKTFREHPDFDTDVYAIDVTYFINEHPEINARWVDYNLFGLVEKRTELDITVGEDIITIGYPLGLRQGQTILPLLRQGLISTQIGKEIQDVVFNSDGSSRKRSLRAFLIDGATIPGSSGSPVVLKPISGRVIKDSIQLGTAPPVLLGIIAETKYAPIRLDTKTTISGFAGLGLAFDVETIYETIELFYTPE